MKIFLSWSGVESKLVAEALADWLPNVIQSLSPWISSGDIEKGSSWDASLSAGLRESKVGIVCVTPSNLTAPWLLFESGALWKAVDVTYVCPYLFRVTPADVAGPLARFQLTTAERVDTLAMLKTINKSLGASGLEFSRLADAFERWWPHLEETLKNIPHSQSQPVAPRSDRAILEELLSLTRSQSLTIQRRSDEAMVNSLLSEVDTGPPGYDELERRAKAGVATSEELERWMRAKNDRMQRKALREIMLEHLEYVQGNVATALGARLEEKRHGQKARIA
jgi:hypothetical protein